MRKTIVAIFIVLIMIFSGCSDVSTALEENDNNELVMEIEAAAETESAESISFSESKESEAPETDTELDTDAQVTERVPVQSETAKQTEPAELIKTEIPDTKPAAEETNSPPVEKPHETQPPAETPTQTVPEDTKPKTAYDFEFDIEAIKADCISIGQEMGLSLDSSLTPSNAAWWNPVTASQSNQGEALKQSLESYIKFHTVENLGSYGIDEITDFNIYCKARGNGAYLIYFFFA